MPNTKLSGRVTTARNPTTASFAAINDTNVNPFVVDIDTVTSFNDAPKVLSSLTRASFNVSRSANTSTLKPIDSSNVTSLNSPQATLVVIVVDVVDVASMVSIDVVVVVMVVDTVEVVDVDVVEPTEDVVDVVVVPVATVSIVGDDVNDGI